MFHAFWIWPFWWVFAPLHGLFTLLLIVLFVSLIFRHRPYPYWGHPWGWNHPYGWSSGPGANRSEALAILEGRYARGEIQRDGYLQKKADLGGVSPPN